MWRKSLGNKCKPIVHKDETRLMGLELFVKSSKFIFFNSYLPYCSPNNHDDFISYLSKMEDIISSANTPYIYFLGDFNADIFKAHLFGQELKQFCLDQQLILSDTLYLEPSTTYTYMSQQTRSWLDHMLCTSSAHSLVTSVNVDYQTLTSDHFPPTIELTTCDAVENCKQESKAYEKNHLISWSELTPEKIQAYTNIFQEQ